MVADFTHASSGYRSKYVYRQRMRGCPMKGTTQVLPVGDTQKSSIHNVLKELHACTMHLLESHIGLERTFEIIRSRFYWPVLASNMKRVQACEMCAFRKSPSRTRRASMQSDWAGYLLQRIAIHILVSLPRTI